MTNKDEFDDLLHEALSEYRDAEPLAGLEARLLERMRARAVSRKAFWLRRALAAAGVAALFVATWVSTTHRVPQTAAPNAESVARPIEPQEHQPAAHVEVPILPLRTLPQRIGTPHRAAAVEVAGTHTNQATPDVFPVPVPLTADERAFVAALERHPDAVRATSDPDLALVIAKIEITPLSTTDEISGENQ